MWMIRGRVGGRESCECGVKMGLRCMGLKRKLQSNQVYTIFWY